MENMTVFSMILGIVITWGIPIAVIVAFVILFKKVNRIEKKLDK